MKLIKENTEKHRAVYMHDNIYRKFWYNINPQWIISHVAILNTLMPNYVLAHGDNWIDFAALPGTVANTVKHTDEFILRIYHFCKEQLKQTLPYAHGDWVLSNIILNGDTICMCDWDNVGIYHPDDILTKLFLDLESAFGKEKLMKVLHDTSGI